MMDTTPTPTPKATKTKIIVLDDDPTGSQTVHSCPLLTGWDVPTLMWALHDDSSPLFFVLTNTRGMSSTEAQVLTREVCHNLKDAIDQLSSSSNININPLLVSRSDSTLRGHYPVETNVIASELGPFDAHFLVPAFFEGGPPRITKDSTHYLYVSDQELIPCHETEFAKDSVFGYSTSYLPSYVEEKTKDSPNPIKADQVVRFRHSDPDVAAGNCQQRLLTLSNNVCCAVDAITQPDLDKFCAQLLQVSKQYNKRFLFRSGASLLTSLAQLPPQPVPPTLMSQYVPHGYPGAVIVGSHTNKTTSQLAVLLQQPNVVGMEVDVRACTQQDQRSKMLTEFETTIQDVHSKGYVPVIYTSRTEVVDFPTQEERLVFGQQVSSFLMDLVHRLPTTLGFCISKGGITSNDVLSKGLELRTSIVLGQVVPGCSVVKCPDNHPRFPNMPVVIFPGNVGDETGLATVLQRLSSSSPPLAPPQQEQYNDPRQIHKMITKRFKELRSQGYSSEDAMKQARDELAPSDDYEPSPGTQVAAMFGMQL